MRILTRITHEITFNPPINATLDVTSRALHFQIGTAFKAPPIKRKKKQSRQVAPSAAIQPEQT